MYRRFVPHYAKIAHPLYQLLKKGRPVQLEGFDEACERAFHKLKDAILAPPVLALPKNDLPYSVDTDASDYQIGAAPFQTHPDSQRKPIAFFSRTLASAERNYSVSEKEFLAVIWAVQTLRPYLYGEHFIVHTDHALLRWLMNVADPSGTLIRWRLRLLEFDFEIKYKKGKANSKADALSRLLTEGETVKATDDEIPCFMAEPADAIEDEEEDFGRVDDILALEGRPAFDRLDHFQAVAPEEFIHEQAVDPFCSRIKEEMDAGKVRTFTTEAVELEGTLCRTAAEFVQVLIPQSLRDRVLGLSHYEKLAGHP